MASGTGSAFGGRLLRYSTVGWASLALTQLGGLASVLVVVRFLGPGEYGRLSLLIFLSGLVNLVVGLCCQTGTLWRVFGISGDDEDEEEESDEAPTESIRTILGTGLALTVLLTALAVGVSIALAVPIAEVLFSEAAGSSLIPIAFLAGGLGALYRLASMCVWMERRPATFFRLAAAHSLLTVVAVVALVVSGAGVAGALAGTAIGSAAAALLALLALRGRFRPAFDTGEAARILGRSPRRVPMITSSWVIDYASIFLLSRYVAQAELGIFHLAARFAMAVGFGAAAVRLALRPLRRTVFFGAVQEQYGPARVRGDLLTYYLLGLFGLVLGASLLLPVLVNLAPPSYAAAAALIPLLTLAQVAPVAFKFLNFAVSFRGQRRAFVWSVIIAAVSFIGFALVLIPWLGLEGAPIGVLLAFVGPTLYFGWRSQRGPEPIVVPYVRLTVAGLAATGCVVAFHATPAPAPVWQLLLGLGLFAAWCAGVVLLGAVPPEHRRALLGAGRAALRRGGTDPDLEQALAALDRDERAALRMAIVERQPLDQIAPVLGADSGDVGERLVRLLRRASSFGDGDAGGPTDEDGGIGECLFSNEPTAVRDSAARRLLKSGRVEAGDLHGLETAMAALARAPREVWLEEPQTTG